MAVDEDVPDTTTTGSSAEDLAAEAARLRAENERLKAEVEGKAAKRHTGLRWTGAVLLLLIGLLLFALAVPTVWINRTIMNTDQWVATVGPLAQDPAIQNAVADKLSNALFAKVDVEAQIRSLLPTALAPVAAPVAAQVQTYADKLITDVVRSDQFSTVWTATMRTTQQAFVAAIKGGKPGGAVSTTNGVITLNTEAFLAAAQERLASTRIAGLTGFIPWDKFPASFVLYESPRLAQAQTAFGLFNSLVWILPFLALLFLALALWVAPNTRRAWLWLGVGLTIVTLLPFEALVFGKTAFINAAYNTAQIPNDAAQAFFDIVFKLLMTMQTTAITVGLVVILIAFFGGPSKLALWFRHAIARGLALARGDAHFGAFGGFVTANKAALRIGAVALGVIVDVLSAPLTPGFVIWTAVFVGLAVVLIEFFGQGAPEPQLAWAGVGSGGVITPAISEVPAESSSVEPEPTAAGLVATADVDSGLTDDTET
jgi:hypothetical protein